MQNLIKPPPQKKKMEIKYGWVGRLIPKPGPKSPNHPENRLSDPNITFRVPKTHKNPGVGGWINTFGTAEVNISSYPATDVAGLFFFVVQKY